MKRTLLDLTQTILSDIDGDEINSIADTFESDQVARMVKESFLAMSSNRNWPSHKRVLQVPSLGDVDKPTHLKVPDDVKELKSLNYNKVRDGETRLRYEPVHYKDNDTFLRKVNRENSDADNIQIVIDPSGVQLLIRNDVPPSIYTSFDDETIVFDTFDNSVDSAIQESKTQAIAYFMPQWLHTDNYEIDLPTDAFAALLNEALSRASLRLRQEGDQKAEQETTRQQRFMSRKSWKVNGGIKYPDYGRRGRKQHRNPYLDKNDRTPDA